MNMKDIEIFGQADSGPRSQICMCVNLICCPTIKINKNIFHGYHLCLHLFEIIRMWRYGVIFQGKLEFKFPLTPMGVVATGSAHTIRSAPPSPHRHQQKFVRFHLYKEKISKDQKVKLLTLLSNHIYFA